MDKQEFGRLLAALRKYHFDPNTGRGWTQRTLAEHTNLTERIIGNIEQGRKAYIEAETLVRLADALCLNPWEREIFFTLAQGIPRAGAMPDAAEPAAILPKLLNTMRALRSPAILYDPLYHVVAMNELGLALHNISGAQLLSQAQQQGCIHFLQHALAPDSAVRHNMREIWTHFVQMHVLRFRILSLRYRHTDYFQKLFEALCSFSEFLQAWITTQSRASWELHAPMCYRYHHPQHGPLAYTSTLQYLWTAAGFVYLSILTPLGEDTATIFHSLSQSAQAEVLYLTPWPHSALRVPG